MRRLEATAVDDALDLFALLIATRLFNPARRASAEQQRLAILPCWRRPPRRVARVTWVLLDQLAAAEDSAAQRDVAALWSAVERIAARAVVVGAIALAAELVPDDDGSADPAMRAVLPRSISSLAAVLARTARLIRPAAAWILVGDDC